MLRVSLQRDIDDTAFRSVANRVIDEVANQYGQCFAVTPHRYGFKAADSEVDVAGVSLWQRFNHDLAHDFIQA